MPDIVETPNPMIDPIYMLRKIARKRPDDVYGLHKPLGSYAVVKLHEPVKETEGGIALTEEIQAKDKQMLATVVAVGPGRLTQTGEYMRPQVQPGDLILLVRHSPMELKVAGELVGHAIAEGDIIAVFKEEEMTRLYAEIRAEEEAEKAAEEAKQPKEEVRPSGLVVVTGTEA